MNTAIHRELARVAFAAVVSLAFLPAATMSAETAAKKTECVGKFREKPLTEKELRKVRESQTKSPTT